MDGVTHIKQTGFHGPENPEFICKPGVTDNNVIGRTVETPVDDRNDLVRKDLSINHSSKGHADSDHRVRAVSRQNKHRYDCRKLSHKWKEHLPLGSKSGNTKQGLIQVFLKLFEGIGRLPSNNRIEL